MDAITIKNLRHYQQKSEHEKTEVTIAMQVLQLLITITQFLHFHQIFSGKYGYG